MKTYLVGGAVRDLLLNVPSHDRDFVVVGATPDDMLAAGFKRVGADFPVFLHPATGDEYALARVERKVGPGYKGFEVVAGRDVTIEEDLGRRDLTINSIAIEVENGQLKHPLNIVDPYNGRLDLTNKILRHTSPAFKEDPLRVLRLARFSARFPDFMITATTLGMCDEMIKAGELAHLTQERVWGEMYKAFSCVDPSRFFAALKWVDAYSRVPGLGPIKAAQTAKVKKLISLTTGFEHQADIVIGTLIAQSGGLPADERLLNGLNSIARKVAKIQAMNWRDRAPEKALERLVKSGALREASKLVTCALAARDEPDVFDRATLEMIMVKMVTADQFPGLDGKALGAALTAARLEALKSLS